MTPIAVSGRKIDYVLRDKNGIERRDVFICQVRAIEALFFVEHEMVYAICGKLKPMVYFIVIAKKLVELLAVDTGAQN
jgi:hypothetical protein